MKLDLKARFRNKTFVSALFALLLTLAHQIGAMFGLDLTFINGKITEVFATLLLILVLLGVIIDPSTEGISDESKGEEE